MLLQIVEKDLVWLLKCVLKVGLRCSFHGCLEVVTRNTMSLGGVMFKMWRWVLLLWLIIEMRVQKMLSVVVVVVLLSQIIIMPLSSS